jgi:1,4-alpha-glucan branching enzyme
VSLAEQDLYLFREGTHTRLYRQMGCQLRSDGATFRVWAPNAAAVSVIGDWNRWDPRACRLNPRDDGSGVWEGSDVDVIHGAAYKFRIVGRDGHDFDKADPYAFFSEVPPATASRAWDLRHEWSDSGWMERRAQHNRLSAPMSIYEVHLGSWRRPNGVLPGYREIAEPLAEYACGQGFTHVELLPITEHPFYGSWGYQTTGYFAPTSRYGTPQDLMHLVDVLAEHGIGVILDWVPSHFPTDAHGLASFDGTYLFEHEDPRQGFHPEWNSAIFNYDRHEVRAFLSSSALFWLDHYHIDGLRVDAVASMLYLDYARREGEWIPNVHGGRENLGAVQFLRQLNEAVYWDYPGTVSSPRSRLPGRWCRGRRRPAAWASV